MKKLNSVVNLEGFKPPTCTLEVCCSIQLSYKSLLLPSFRAVILSSSATDRIVPTITIRRGKELYLKERRLNIASSVVTFRFYSTTIMRLLLWRKWNSNPRPSECKSDALPTELYPQVLAYLSSRTNRLNV